MSCYAFSDLHGQYDLWKQIQDFLKEDDTAYFLGDAIDRGPHRIEIMKEILDDKRITYIMGNHEEFFLEEVSDIFYGVTPYLWLGNGGADTVNTLCNMQEKDAIDLREKFKRQAVFYADFINKKGQHIFLSHAGFEPWISHEEIFLKDGYSRYYWDREHIVRPWTTDSEYDNSIVVHGHTPYLYCLKFLNKRVEDNPSIVTYCNGHKIDIDLCSFVSKKTALLNLDTLEPIYFKESEDEGYSSSITRA